MIRRRLNKMFFCPFWGHSPDELSWWAVGDVVTIDATERCCTRCGEKIHADA